MEKVELENIKKNYLEEISKVSTRKEEIKTTITSINKEIFDIEEQIYELECKQSELKRKLKEIESEEPNINYYKLSSQLHDEISEYMSNFYLFNGLKICGQEFPLTELKNINSNESFLRTRCFKNNSRLLRCEFLNPMGYHNIDISEDLEYGEFFVPGTNEKIYDKFVSQINDVLRSSVILIYHRCNKFSHEDVLLFKKLFYQKLFENENFNFDEAFNETIKALAIEKKETLSFVEFGEPIYEYSSNGSMLKYAEGDCINLVDELKVKKYK